MLDARVQARDRKGLESQDASAKGADPRPGTWLTPMREGFGSQSTERFLALARVAGPS
jgi:hypothetical protein